MACDIYLCNNLENLEGLWFCLTGNGLFVSLHDVSFYWNFEGLFVGSSHHRKVMSCIL